MPMRRFSKPLPEGKVRRHVHSPTTIEDINDKNTKAQITEDGRVIISQIEGEYEDEINVPASFIFTIANMLNTTRRTKIINREDIPK